MPLHWTADSKERLLITIADGDVTREEAESYIAAVNGAGTHTYRKLFDGSRGETSMTPEDMLALGVQIRAWQSAGRSKPGPFAVVVPPGKASLVSRILGILATADRPMRVFSESEPARRWIESLPK
jgi:hypothetical protein